MEITGFTITKGKKYECGGIYVLNSAFTISHNRIQGNEGALGGGIYAEVGESVPFAITQNTISDNTGHFGIGLHLIGGRGTITDNTISDCDGGVLVMEGEHTISQNTIQNNRSSGMVLSHGKHLVTQNIITGNTSLHDGGGLFLEHGTHIIADNTISKNKAHKGCGMYLCYVSI